MHVDLILSKSLNGCKLTIERKHNKTLQFLEVRKVTRCHNFIVNTITQSRIQQNITVQSFL